MSANHPLPEFGSPPVTEVALSLQFEPLTGLTAPTIGLLWGKYKNLYPTVEQLPPLEPVIEQFSGEVTPNVKVRFQVFDSPPPSRVWFVKESGEHLIQVQQDRFVHNWRKMRRTDKYPRYTVLKNALVQELSLFGQFIEEERLGGLVFNQTEVTFVNTIDSGEGWERHGELSKIMTIHSASYSDNFFQEPENIQTVLRYIIPGEEGVPIGRLHISVVPVVNANKKPGFVLTLIARCAPDGSRDDAFRCLDLGHDWIVRGFTSITTKVMHQIWERQDV